PRFTRTRTPRGAAGALAGELLSGTASMVGRLGDGRDNRRGAWNGAPASERSSRGGLEGEPLPTWFCTRGVGGLRRQCCRVHTRGGRARWGLRAARATARGRSQAGGGR